MMCQDSGRQEIKKSPSLPPGIYTDEHLEQSSRPGKHPEEAITVMEEARSPHAALEGFARFCAPGLWGSGCEEAVGRIVRLRAGVVCVSEAIQGHSPPSVRPTWGALPLRGAHSESGSSSWCLRYSGAKCKWGVYARKRRDLLDLGWGPHWLILRSGGTV